MVSYQCQNCKRIWQFPLSVCPYCLTEVKERESVKATVTSVCRVGIPTLFHPSVPYFILLLEDELGNVWAQKSEIEYKPGAEFKVLANNDSNAVSIVKTKYSARDNISKTFAAIGGINTGKDTKIVILPTLASMSHYYFRDNTSPEFLEAVLSFLLKSGAVAENISVAAQSFDDMPIGAAAQKSGLLKTCQKFNITPLDIALTQFQKTGENGKFEVSTAVLGADLVLNLPMLKMGQAQAVKNLFMILKKENYLGLKYLESDVEIARFFDELSPKIVTLADGEYTQRSNKLTAYTGVMLAGRNAANVDRVFNEVTKANNLPETVKDIRIENIPIAGRTIKEAQYQAEIY